MDLNRLYSIIDRDIKSIEEFFQIRDELIKFNPNLFIKINPKEYFDITLAIANLEINIETPTCQITINRDYLIENSHQIEVKDLIY